MLKLDITTPCEECKDRIVRHIERKYSFLNVDVTYLSMDEEYYISIKSSGKVTPEEIFSLGVTIGKLM